VAVVLTITVRTRKTRREVVRAVRRACASPGTTAVTEAIGTALLGQVKETYLSRAQGHTDKTGLRWQPLSPVTVKRKGSEHPILIDTGRLLASLDTTPGAPEQVFRTSDGRVDVGTLVPYAVFHHEGKPPKLPQRRLWPRPAQWSGDFWAAILSRARDALAGEIAKEIAR
jgi:Phage virion morphogenesis family